MFHTFIGMKILYGKALSLQGGCHNDNSSNDNDLYFSVQGFISITLKFMIM